MSPACIKGWISAFIFKPKTHLALETISFGRIDVLMISNSQEMNQEFATSVVMKLRNAGYQALWAGGCVRDVLMHNIPKDYDVATSAIPDQVIALFGARKCVAVGASFGVVVVIAPHGTQHVEVATFRTDGSYLDGRRPSTVTFSTPEEDAQRRDFTINGMFFDPVEKKILDYVGGETDLALRQIRAIGNPRDRFAEDYLRMLRAVRFAARFQFTIDPETALAIKELVHKLPQVSAERITDELHRMLSDQHRATAVALCREYGLWSEVFPIYDHPRVEQHGIETVEEESTHWDNAYLQLQALNTTKPELSWVILLNVLPDVVTDQAAKDEFVSKFFRPLRLSNAQLDLIQWLYANQFTLNEPQQLPLEQLKRTLQHAYCTDLLELIRVRNLALHESSDAYDYCVEYLAQTPANVLNPPELINGADLIQHGYKPGKLFKIILDKIRNEQLAERIHSREEAFKLAEHLSQQPH